MYNVINKFAAAALLAAALFPAGCSDSARKGAEELMVQSAKEIEARNFTGAILLLDTLNKRYPDQVDVRRQALRIRAKAMEGMAMDSIAAGDVALAQAAQNLDAIRADFYHVDSSVGLEGYFLPKGTSDKVMTSTGVQARVTDKGYFYIVANVQGRAIGLNSIDFRDGAASIQSSEISPARVVKVEGSESASFNPEDLQGVGEWLKEHPSASAIVLLGTSGKAEIKLDKKLYKELVACYEFSSALQAQHLAGVKREKYERMLATARDQLANLPVNDNEK